MNETAKRIQTAPVPQPRLRAEVTSGADSARLAAIIEENRLKLQRGWDELDRLTRVLASLDALQTRGASRDTDASRAAAAGARVEPAAAIAA
jgi:hypothetical protein